MSVIDERAGSAATQQPLEHLPRPRSWEDAAVVEAPLVTYHGRVTSASAEAVRALLAEERAIWGVMLFCLALAIFGGTMIGLAIHVWVSADRE